MRYRNYTVAIFTLAAALLLFTGLHASAASIKDQMLARLPAINALKDKGIIGENNQGYLQYRSNDKPQQNIVQAENNDRKAVYGAIAKNQGVDIKLVGQRRANQIADKGQGGHWYQKPDGSWYKK